MKKILSVLFILIILFSGIYLIYNHSTEKLKHIDEIFGNHKVNIYGDIEINCNNLIKKECTNQYMGMNLYYTGAIIYSHFYEGFLFGTDTFFLKIGGYRFIYETYKNKLKDYKIGDKVEVKVKIKDYGIQDGVTDFMIYHIKKI